MLNSDTKRHIDAARDVLVGVAPNPTTQIDQITYALIYKFMDDMDQAAIKAGGEPSFFTGDLEQYAWSKLVDSRMGNQEKMNLYGEALVKFSEAKQLPELFRIIFRAAFLPYRSPETLGLFLKEISYFDYSHPEELGNAYEYLLSIMSSQGDAGQFRTPRHIIDFVVDVVDPKKDDTVLDPACGTGGFLVSTYNHILEQHDGKSDPQNTEKALTPDERKKLMANLQGYDIDPTMVRIAQVNMFLHQFKNPQIFQYDSLTNDDRWNDKFDVVLANPPFMTPKGGIKPHDKFGVNAKRAEVLFVDYILSHLRPNGKAGIVVPEGIVFQTGNAYRELRKNLVENGLYAVVSLPSGVFQPYSGVKTSILFVDKSIGDKDSEVLFLNIKELGISLGAAKKQVEGNDLPIALENLRIFQQGKEITVNQNIFTVPKSKLADSDYKLTSALYRPLISDSGDFEYKQLGDVCSIEKGKSSSTKTLEGPFPLVLTAKSFKTSEHFDFEGDGVAVPLISSTGHGKADISRVHFVQGKFALANLLALVQPLSEFELNAKFLYYVLDSQKDNLAQLMNGAANVSMKPADLETFTIPIPSLTYQEKLVAELDSYTEIIKGAKAIIENWRPSIEIDPDWQTFELGEIFEIEGGSTPDRDEPMYWDGDIPWATLADFEPGINILHTTKQKITERGLANSSAKLLPIDTILVSTSATIGRVAICGIPMATNQRFKNLLPTGRCLPKFGAYLMGGYQDEMKRLASGGTFLELSKKELSKMKISLPDLEVQKQIVSVIAEEEQLMLAAAKLSELYSQKLVNRVSTLWD